MGDLTWDRALAWRMGRHHLVDRAAPPELVGVVSDICGLHAQLMSSAELSLWARIDGLERGAFDEALWNERALVKVWAMRGTLHVLPSDELGIWVAALSTYTGRAMTGKYADDAFTDAVGQALERGFLTREELADAVVEITGLASLGEVVRFSWGSSLKPASWRGRLCFAPSEGGRVRLTSPANWLRDRVAEVDAADALRDVTRRFLAAYAPVTAEHFGVWGGFGRARGGRMINTLGDEAVELDVDGERAWALAGDAPAIGSAETRGVARLLPAFDPWIIGALRNAPSVVELKHKARVYRAQGWISPVLLVNGRIVGVWKHTRKGRRLLVELEPFGKLPAWARSALKEEAERLAQFLGGELELEITQT